MSRFFQFLASQWQGIFVFVLLLLTAVLLVQWIAWVFSLGRFAGPRPARRDTLRYVFADLVVKIIDDFRHLLALVIVVIFALALTYTLVLASYERVNRLAAASDALQAVVSSLGGLIGAIIGYYFGEKAGERAAASGGAAPPREPAAPSAQAAPADAGAGPPVKAAPAPPTLHDESESDETGPS